LTGENVIALLLCTLTARAHDVEDPDDDGWEGGSDCSPLDPTTFPGARERCDGVDNDCDCKENDEGDIEHTDECVDEDGACVDDVMPCYQVETASQPALDGDPCLLASNPNGSEGCAVGSEAFLLVGLLAFRRRRLGS
jgi:hypothetical protein